MNYASGFIALCLMLNGCASKPAKPSTSSRKISHLQKTIRAQSEELAMLHEKLFVIEALLQKQNLREDKRTAAKGASAVTNSQAISEKPEVSQQAAIQSEFQNRSAAALPEKVSSKGEHFLYAKVIEQYRKGPIEGLEKSVELLTKSFPKSVHADNALYLLGQKYFQRGQLQKSLVSFTELQRLYPLGNKFAAAALASAITLKKLKKNKGAKSILASISRQFPGSREAYFSRTELSLSKVGEM